jgi:hypothetical protein
MRANVQQSFSSRSAVVQRIASDHVKKDGPFFLFGQFEALKDVGNPRNPSEVHFTGRCSDGIGLLF